ncbi:MAG: type IVB secretion system protein IcmJDotN [Legionellales bacterium]|nr:type IVB secretion system protein IcmJDotN [Legionellales bacterium]
MHQLSLAVNPINWRLHTARKADPAFQAFTKRVLERDNHTCQYCGFQARQYQEIVNIDMDYNRNVIANLATACCFCTQCFFLDAVGKSDYGGGTLIVLPEISQNDLNAFCHVLFCAMTNATAYQSSAQAIYRSFKFRAQALEEQFGAGTSRPAFFGQLLNESMQADAKLKTAVLKNVRLLPSHAKFRKQIETWAQAALDEIPDNA